ncbi:MAG: hypothetical protein J7L11_07885 [Thermoprotei archaeon]|nr:hypothetical protein [Thermoprotei archaeon]
MPKGKGDADIAKDCLSLLDELEDLINELYELGTLNDETKDEAYSAVMTLRDIFERILGEET